MEKAEEVSARNDVDTVNLALGRRMGYTTHQLVHLTCKLRGRLKVNPHYYYYV